MFDERRQTTVKGIDRSYPLEPLENKLRKQAANTNGLATQRNGNLTTVNRQSVNVKRVARADVNSNVNAGKPVVSYREEVTRESFGPSIHHHDDEDEFGAENRVANGHHRHDLDNEVGKERCWFSETASYTVREDRSRQLESEETQSQHAEDFVAIIILLFRIYCSVSRGLRCAIEKIVFSEVSERFILASSGIW